MGKYRLTFKKSVAKDLRALPTKDIARILKRIRSLADEPRPLGCEKLSGQERYRVRQGAYRIIYEINDDELVVIVVKVGHRGGIYRKKGDS
jgi:mRNA interferase RelE/StbE